jgi:putative ABC transport system substrate-binding protein
MKRRDFLILAATAIAWPHAARPQQKAMSVIGFLGLAPASGWDDQVEALRAGLRDFGDVEGNNIHIEFRWAASTDQLSEFAAELVRMNVDVIIAPASTEVEPARQATKTIPIVFTQHADPVGLRHVASLPHPGGNITGVSMVLTELSAKALEILKDALPDARRIGVLWNPTTPSHPQVVEAIRVAAKSLGVQVIMTPIERVTDFEAAFATLRREQADGFLVPSSPLTNAERIPLADLALRYRLPGIYVNKENAEAGGLMSYGADFNYMYRHAALYVHKILRGEKPGDLPVEQASKYQLVINLKTAKALDLKVPPLLLTQADEVIE